MTYTWCVTRAITDAFLRQKFQADFLDNTEKRVQTPELARLYRKHVNENLFPKPTVFVVYVCVGATPLAVGERIGS